MPKHHARMTAVVTNQRAMDELRLAAELIEEAAEELPEVEGKLGRAVQGLRYAAEHIDVVTRTSHDDNAG